MAARLGVYLSHHFGPRETALAARLAAELRGDGAQVWTTKADFPVTRLLEPSEEGGTGCHWIIFVTAVRWLLCLQDVHRDINAALHALAGGRLCGVALITLTPCDEHLLPSVWGHLPRLDASQGYDALCDQTRLMLGVRSRDGHGSVTPRLRPDPLLLAELTDHFPTSLERLGYARAVLRGAEVLVPPVCAVPAGAFLMGGDARTDKDAGHNERPPHWQLALGAFEIARHPVTVAEYACFLRATGRPAPQGDDALARQVSWPTQLYARRDHPMVMVSWHDATAYAAWLSARTRDAWRLPREAEWEKAARWDPDLQAARRYPWGDTYPYRTPRCNANDTRASTMPIGSYPGGVSPCGAHDLAGNVWEWTSSLYTPYPYDAADGREDMDAPGARVQRGGAWDGSPECARSAFRACAPPATRGATLGFRLLRDA